MPRQQGPCGATGWPGHRSSLQGVVLMMQLKTRLGTVRWLLGVTALACMSACVSLPPVSGPVSRPSGAAVAAALAARGEHAQAAAQYESLATSAAPAERANLQLAAAREWLAAARPADAARVLRALLGPLTAAQSYQRSLLAAEAALAAGRVQYAWQQISTLVPSAEPAAAEQYQLLRMRIALASGRPVQGIRAELDAEQAAGSPAAEQPLRLQLLAALLQAREHGVRLDLRASRDPIVRGWLALGATAAEPGSMSLNGAALAARWHSQYPDHPANSILAQAFPAPLVSAAPGTRVALLLPLTGAASPQGSTVRDGFLSAYYQLPAAGRPDLHLYDTGSTAAGATQALAQARAAGSTFVVGPLLHDAVSAVAALGAQPTPVLALNFLPDGQPAPGRLYQYAINPEQAARMVARRLLADGRRQGIAVVPRDSWGSEVVSAFERELTLGGGSMIAVATYDPAGHDYGDELRGVLRIDDSEARHQRLQRVLGTKLNFEPRHRGDIEFVFVVPETAINARLIEPQLRYSYAGDIPSYSISEAYEPDMFDANRDIDGLMYPDMPWMIPDQTSIASLRTMVGQTWGNRAAWQSRLFAFGYDACQLMLAMSAPAADAGRVQIDGLTGQLSFDARGRVQRELIWVRINADGKPRPMGTAFSANLLIGLISPYDSAQVGLEALLPAGAAETGRCS